MVKRTKRSKRATRTKRSKRSTRTKRTKRTTRSKQRGGNNDVRKELSKLVAENKASELKMFMALRPGVNFKTLLNQYGNSRFPLEYTFRDEHDKCKPFNSETFNILRFNRAILHGDDIQNTITDSARACGAFEDIMEAEHAFKRRNPHL